MKKTAIIYTSKYGSTEQYAKWIAEATGGDLFVQKSCKAKELIDYDVILYGGAVHAGGILGLDFLKKNISKLEGKKIVVFAVGLNVNSFETQEECREINFVKKLKNLPCYFLPGAYYPEKVSGIDKTLMGVVKKMISKADNDENQKKLLDAIENGADYKDKNAIKQIVDFIAE